MFVSMHRPATMTNGVANPGNNASKYFHNSGTIAVQGCLARGARQMAEETEFDVEAVEGAFSRCNVTLAPENFTDEHARKFYTYLHGHSTQTLGQEIAERKRAAIGARRQKRGGPLLRSDIFERMLRVFRYFIKARWSLFLRRNAGLTIMPFFSFRGAFL